jgi:hypothetical protein
MFEANELRLLETAVECHLSCPGGETPHDSIAAQQRMLAKIRRMRWIMDKTPMRFKRHGQEHTGTITEFRNWEGIEMVGIHTDEGAYYWIATTYLIGPV